VESATLVAVTVIADVLPVGAVKIPVLEMVPAEAVQITAELLVPWTVAENLRPGPATTIAESA
jgi:hypothetical protein